MTASEPQAMTLEEFLIRDNAAMRRAGCELAEAALNVIREYDGTHRLALAAAAWMQTIADEGGRGETHGGVPVVARDEAAEHKRGPHWEEIYKKSWEEARDEAAELRAAVNELLASGGAHGIERRLQLIENGKGERDRLEAAYARVCALAASEGQP